MRTTGTQHTGTNSSLESVSAPFQQEIISLLADAWQKRNTHPKTSQELAEKALRLSEQHDFSKGIAESYATLAECYFWLSEYEDGIGFAEKSLALFKTLNDLSGQARAFNTLGNIYQRIGDYDAALENHTQSLKLRDELGVSSDKASSLNNLGNIYLETGDYPNALQNYMNSLQLMQEAKDARGMAGCYNNIGNIYQRLEEYEDALDYYHKCLTLTNNIKDRWIEASCLNNLGSLFHQNKDYDKALAYYHDSLEISRELEDRWGKGLLLANIGNVHLSQSENKKAHEFFIKSLLLTSEIDDTEGKIEALLGLGKLAYDGGNISEALTYLSEALSLTEEGGFQELCYRTHELLSDAYELLGDISSAYKHYKAFNEMREAYFSNEMKKKTRVLKVRYESEQNLKEKEIYRLKNEELAAAYERLRSLNRTLREANEQKSQLLEQLRVQTIALEKQTREDPLTGLYNRRYLTFLLLQEFERAKRYNSALGVAMADIDHFKNVNDTFSHQVGDEVLKIIAKIFIQNCRIIDTVARYGGEEFVFFFPETPLDKAVSASEKIRKAVANYDWNSVEKGLTVTVSIGVTANIDVPSHEKMLSLADEKLYEAKATGRNRVCY
ncbi:diguanylate cyclase and serine/threonine protein kinase with TPR repeats [Chloroherpeton thalassium ATCC 35110]|uniref:diguanylate cyclase n=1 Tax=Chloroherpeton thalassium (strain ATCC 35110 / GB-78) TaxID=517418 RepID=B3QT84_CHLT3|nr:tetratricopeptide repeat protein [Chloroherpeton thalassium]ACF14183.1 diguanylate cyclase and serine/threonine protein kinase with TPR repeats [Chloroherpeton thalassium ATCC 35110]